MNALARAWFKIIVKLQNLFDIDISYYITMQHKVINYWPTLTVNMLYPAVNISKTSPNFSAHKSGLYNLQLCVDKSAVISLDRLFTGQLVTCRLAGCVDTWLHNLQESIAWRRENSCLVVEETLQWAFIYHYRYISFHLQLFDSTGLKVWDVGSWPKALVW